MTISKNDADFESVRRYFLPPPKSYFLFGPRGTGKSTFIKTNYPNAVLIDLLDVDIYRRYLASPNLLKALAEANPDVPIVIDEVQKIPDLLSIVHALIEQNKTHQFILTGSSARKLKRTGVDLLAGRALLRHLHPFIASELGHHFELKKALCLGMLPLVWDSVTPQEDLRTYVALYIKEEVQMEGLSRKIDSFGRFIEVISFSQGNSLNYSNIARDCGVSSKSVETYISILEDLLLAFRLPVFTRNAVRHLTQHPKFYYFDAGVYRSVRPSGPLDRAEEILGIALETLIFQHLQAWIQYSSDSNKLYFWRTKAGLEVDFVIYGPNTFCSIEVKHASRIQKEDLKGLHAFGEDFPQAQKIMLYQGKERLRFHDILCIPCESFLRYLTPNKTLFPD